MYLSYEAIRPEETRCSSSVPDTKKSRSCIKDLVLKHGSSTDFLQARPHALSPHTAHQAVTTDGSLLPATSPSRAYSLHVALVWMLRGPRNCCFTIRMQSLKTPRVHCVQAHCSQELLCPQLGLWPLDFLFRTANKLSLTRTGYNNWKQRHFPISPSVISQLFQVQTTAGMLHPLGFAQWDKDLKGRHCEPSMHTL